MRALIAVLCIVSIASCSRTPDETGNGPAMNCVGARRPAAPHAHRYRATRNAPADVNDSALAYAFGHFHDRFGATVDLTLPKVRGNRGFYADWLLLTPIAPPGGQFTTPFVQINFLRWAKYDYRPELAYTWQLPGGKLIYTDSSIFLDDRKPHRFGIDVDGPEITMNVDGRTVCHAKTATFFPSTKTLYYQIGNEASHYGDRIAGVASNIRIREDGDARLRAYKVTCAYRGHGLRWTQGPPGTFVASGVLDEHAGRTYDGGTPGTHCATGALENQ